MAPKKFLLQKNCSFTFSQGIPGLKSFSTLEPLHIKKIKFHHNQPPIDLHIHLQEVDINGLGDVKATETR